MNWKAPAIFAALLLIAAAPAAGQVPNSITVAPQSSDIISVPHDGSINATVDVTIECGAFVESASTSVAVSATNADGTITAPEVTVSIAPQDCLTGAGSVTVPAELVLTPTSDAMGIVTQEMTATATVGSLTGNGTFEAAVTYRPGHTVTPDIQFPYTINGNNVTFNVTLEFSGNARSMIMFEDQDCPGCNVVGLRPEIAEPPATVTLEVEFQGGEGMWNTTNFTFRNFSHYLLATGGAGGNELEETITWQFIQGDVPASECIGEGCPSEEESPGPALAIVVVGLMGLAFLRRRQ